MREIKFKFWDSERKAMMVDFSGFNENLGINEMFEYLKENKILPLQFTGLKDKNDKEIFEGDTDGLREVKYESDYAGFVIWDGKNYVKLTCDAAFFFSVSGNIYEHPELLNDIDKGLKK